MATSKKKAGDSPAAPVTEVRESVEHAQVYPGLTKREFFAGCALMGAAANDALDETELAQRAVSASDALLTALAEGA